MKKVKITGWILNVDLSDGREVTMDVDDEAAQGIDDFLSAIEKSGEVEDWIVKGGSCEKRAKS